MTRTGWDRVALAALLATAAVLAHRAEAQEPAQQPTTGRRIGEKLDEAAAVIRRDVDRAGDAVRDQFHKAKASINAMGIEGRVYGRLRWDKALDVRHDRRHRRARRHRDPDRDRRRCAREGEGGPSWRPTRWASRAWSTSSRPRPRRPQSRPASSPGRSGDGSDCREERKRTGRDAAPRSRGPASRPVRCALSVPFDVGSVDDRLDHLAPAPGRLRSGRRSCASRSGGARSGGRDAGGPGDGSPRAGSASPGRCTARRRCAPSRRAASGPADAWGRTPA